MKLTHSTRGRRPALISILLCLSQPSHVPIVLYRLELRECLWKVFVGLRCRVAQILIHP